MRCNNRDDLFPLRFKSKIFYIFGGIYTTQSDICDAAFIAKIVSP